MSDFVSASAPTGGVNWGELKGKLLVIEPLSIEKDIQTSYGPSDAVRANVYVITGPGTSDDYEDTLVFPKLLQGQLRGQIGNKVVGRLGAGVAKPGQSAPHLLEEATPDDLAKAQEWATKRAPAVTSAKAPF